MRSAGRSPSSSVQGSPARFEKSPLRSRPNPSSVDPRYRGPWGAYSSSSAQASPARFENSPLGPRVNASSSDPRYLNPWEEYPSSITDRRNRRRSNPIVLAAHTIGSCFRPRSSRSSVKEDPPLSSKSPSDFRLASATSSPGRHFRGHERKRSGAYSRECNSFEENSKKRSFTMEEIHRATRNFSSDLMVGQGGFGTVYKGVLDDGTLVAIKRAKKGKYHNHISAEFRSEIQMLAQVEHLNLVKFFGYLEDGDEKIIVVEYISNGTLREHLDCLRGKPLKFAARLDIAIDVAHAVTYLHMYTDHPIIHRDIKSSNVLLMDNHRAKVSDFGFARLGVHEKEVTHISTEVKGTPGYLDPEYLRTFQLTDKSDVYSFGVLLVELVSGRRPIEPKRELRQRITTKWAMKNLVDRCSFQTLDPNLGPTPAADMAVKKTLELASQCLAPTRHDRPSMRRCAEVLWRIRKDYMELSSSELGYSPSRDTSSTSFISGSIPEDAASL